MANPNTTTRAVRGASNAMTPSRSFRAEAQVFTPAARSRVDDIDGEYYPLEVDTFMPGSPPETPFLRPSQLHTSTETTPRGPTTTFTQHPPAHPVTVIHRMAQSGWDSDAVRASFASNDSTPIVHTPQRPALLQSDNNIWTTPTDMPLRLYSPTPASHHHSHSASSHHHSRSTSSLAPSDSISMKGGVKLQSARADSVWDSPVNTRPEEGDPSVRTPLKALPRAAVPIRKPKMHGYNYFAGLDTSSASNGGTDYAPIDSADSSPRPLAQPMLRGSPHAAELGTTMSNRSSPEPPALPANISPRDLADYIRRGGLEISRPLRRHDLEALENDPFITSHNNYNQPANPHYALPQPPALPLPSALPSQFPTFSTRSRSSIDLSNSSSSQLSDGIAMKRTVRCGELLDYPPARPTAWADICGKLPFKVRAQQEEPHTFGVLKFGNVAYGVTKNEIIACIGERSEIVNMPPSSGHYAIHIEFDRSSAKSGDAYVEFPSFVAADTFLKRVHGRDARNGRRKIGDRIINITLSSQTELMKLMFPKAKDVHWEDHQPCILPPKESYSRGFQGFVTGEEMVMTARFAAEPHKSRFTGDHYQRPYESMISLLFKYPWFATNYYTLGERDLIFSTVLKHIHTLVNHIQRHFAEHVLHETLLDDLLHAGLECPSFSESQRAQLIAAAVGLVQPRTYVPPVAADWPFECVSWIPGTTDEAFDFYGGLLRGAVMEWPKNKEELRYAQASMLELNFVEMSLKTALRKGRE